MKFFWKDNIIPFAQMLHKAVDRATIEPLKPADPSSGGGRLVVYCKDFMVCVLDIGNYDDAVAVCNSVQILSNLSQFCDGLLKFY